MSKATNVKVRSQFNYDRKAASRYSATRPGSEPSKTVQSEKDNCDINIIVKRFNVTGHMPQGSVRTPSYGDFTDVNDFHSAMRAVRAAEESFMAMPSVLRNKFRNDPQEFVKYCSERDDNGKLVHLEEMRKLGLAIPAKDDIIPPKADVPPVKENGDVNSKSGAGAGGASSGNTAKGA